MKTRASSLAVILALALTLAAHTASASHQAAGCRSTAPQSGQLISPTLNLEAISVAELRFNTWWEIESVAPSTRDLLRVEYSANNGVTWQPANIARLNPTQPDSGASPSSPHSNRGLAQRPGFEARVHILDGVAGEPDVRVRFVFDSVDQDRNGFRGWAIDDVRITDQIEPVATPRTTFEPGNGADWTFGGNWHVISEDAGVAMSSQIVPALVTLGANDDGTLPPDPDAEHAQYAWFGHDATGTYCDAGALAEPPAPPSPSPSPSPNLAPTAAFNVSPPAAKTSDTVSFDGSPSSDPEGALASHTWDFGDGSPPATGPTATHAYAKEGTYTVTLTVADALGATSTATYALRVDSNLGDRIEVADKLDDLSHPTAFKEVNVEPTDGPVFIQIDGRASAAQVPGAPRGFIPLTQAAQVPINSILETGRGKVMVESARQRRGRRTQTAEFFDGRFQMRQPRVRSRHLVTEMVLKGGGFRACPRARQSASWSRANDAQRRRRNSRVRRLWGNGRGRFRTRGRYSSATVRGTKWLVEDRCNGTLTRLPRRPRTSRVDVRDLVARRTIRLRAGRSYLARPRAARR